MRSFRAHRAKKHNDIEEDSSYCKENTTLLHYKDQFINAEAK
jgi:hypothetical protein